MDLKTKYVLLFEEGIFGGEFDHYPTEDEIEAVFRERFPLGYIDDQFANRKIIVQAQVKKYYTLEEK